MQTPWNLDFSPLAILRTGDKFLMQDYEMFFFDKHMTTGTPSTHEETNDTR